MPITATATILNIASEVARSANRAQSAWQRASFRKCAVGQQHSEHAKQNGKPAKYEHYLILTRSQQTATLTLNGG
jgi:hypothetical protein